MQILTRYNKVIAHSEYGYTPVGHSAVCVVTSECYDNVHIISVDCVPTDINQYDYYYVNGKFIKGDAKTYVVEVNQHKKLHFWVGTQEEYDALDSKARQGLFAIITDDATKEALFQSIEDIKNGTTIVGHAAHADGAETAKTAEVAEHVEEATHADNADFAKKDSDGNTITDTYASVSNGYSAYLGTAVFKRGTLITCPMTGTEQKEIGTIIPPFGWYLHTNKKYATLKADDAYCPIENGGIVCGMLDGYGLIQIL